MAIKVVLIALATLALAACSFQRETGDDWIMTLPGSDNSQHANTVEAAPKANAATLKVSLPDAPSWLESQRVAVRRPDGAFDYYIGARWADMLTLQLQGALVSSLSAGPFAQVVADDVAAPTLYRLNVQIVDFEITHDAGQKTAIVKVNYALQRELKDIAGGTASGQATMAGETRAEIQQGFADAYRMMADDLRQQLAQRVEKSGKIKK